ncbi:MAG: murein biosynthesis integral membrane protein MurJ [Candidatus Nanopelagicales bacterium]|nr:murein biosynthesis integral membrane protein MurJ [Candidatus Nanopelagicales bacterium]MCF8540125.1 murein biosynthesis integral membrane protein MurJ [Candidatus Nanopelagicales bacterium]
MSERSLIGPSSVMAVGTVTSRITGVLRDITMTAALGFFLVSDAYSLGNSLPTMIYILVIGGALNAVFIPQLVRKMKEDADDGRAYADRLITLTGIILLILSVLAVVLAPLIVDLYTPSDYPQREFDLAVAFARLCLPQIFFYGVYAMLSQVLNSRGKFGAPMFAPIANNVVAIATFLLFIGIAGTSAAADGVLTTDQVLLLGIGTTVGVVAQAVILLPVLGKAGYHWKPRFDWRGHGLGKAGSLALWTIGLVLVNQLTYLVITRLATQANVNAAAAGEVAAGLTTYQKAHLVFILPHSVITVSIVTALLPALSRVAHAGKLSQVGRDISGAMRLVAFLIIPVTAILFVAGIGVAVLLFGYGAATTEQAELLGLVISIFMLGLIPFTLFYVLLRGYYAVEDTRTPFIVTVIFSVVLLALLVPTFSTLSGGGTQIAFIALCYSLAYWVGLIIAWIVLARRLRGTSETSGMQSGQVVWSITRMVMAALVSVVAMSLTTTAVNAVVYGAGSGMTYSDKWVVLVRLVIVSIVGLVVYLLGAWALRIQEIGIAQRVIAQKLHRRVAT